MGWLVEKKKNKEQTLRLMGEWMGSVNLVITYWRWFIDARDISRLLLNIHYRRSQFTLGKIANLLCRQKISGSPKI